MEWIIWVGIAICAICLLVFGVIAFLKASPEKRKELITRWLVGVVLDAEDMLRGHGRGAEKMQLVKEIFAKYAPKTYKILTSINHFDLEEMIEAALAWVKEQEWYEQ